MSKKDEALKLALEALNTPRPLDSYPPLWRAYKETINKAITAIREALAEQPAPVAEPVATVAEVHMSRYTLEWTNGPLPEGTVLYSGPQPAPVRQEPVAWGVDWGRAGDQSCVSIIKRLPDGGIEVLATEYGPPASKPWAGLTDEQITAGARALCKQMAEACGVDVRDQWQLYSDTFKEDAKAVLEAAHGIKEKNT